MHFWCTVTSVRTMKIADGITKPLIVPLFHGKPCWEQLQARTYDLEDCYRDFDCYVKISISCNVFLAFSY